MLDCPRCKGTNTIRVHLQAGQALTDRAQLAGAHLTTAGHTAVAACNNCDLRVTGRLVNATISEDGSTYTGGHFRADPIRAGAEDPT